MSILFLYFVPGPISTDAATKGQCRTQWESKLTLELVFYFFVWIIYIFDTNDSFIIYWYLYQYFHKYDLENV